MRSLVSVAVLLYGGCGGSSADKPSSLDQSKQMANLSKDELKQYCKEMRAYRDKKVPRELMTKLSCAGTAIAMVATGNYKDDAEIRDACRKTLAECSAKPPPTNDKDIDCESDAAVGELTHCGDLTVGEAMACAIETNDKAPAIAADPCALVSAADARQGLTRFIEQLKSPKCDVVGAKCKGKGDAAAPAKEDDPAQVEVVAKLEGFTKQMCECADKACADKVSADLQTWGAESAQRDLKKPSPALAKRATASMTRYTGCMAKFEAGSAK